jgi:hypothetical protein
MAPTYLITSRVRAILAALVTMLLMASPVRADVSWNFIVTASTDLGCPSCPPPPLPSTGGGSLTVSNAAFLRGSLEYSYVIVFNPDQTIGADIARDADFHLMMGSEPRLPTIPQVNYSENSLNERGMIDVSFSADGTLNGIIGIHSTQGNVDMDIINSVFTDTYWDSDGFVPGCGGFTQCRISGYWELTSALPQAVSEPSSLTLLLSGIIALGMRRRNRNRRPKSVIPVCCRKRIEPQSYRFGWSS